MTEELNAVDVNPLFGVKLLMVIIEIVIIESKEGSSINYVNSWGRARSKDCWQLLTGERGGGSRKVDVNKWLQLEIATSVLNFLTSTKI